MNLFVKLLLGLLILVTLAALYVLNPRQPTPEGASSAALYQPGALTVIREPVALTDSSRPTQPNGDFGGLPRRELNGLLWYPAERQQDPLPVIVYSHGFMSSAAEPEYLARFLVPKGYVLVAVNYPLSHGRAPGGANALDVIHQPGDLSFVIDSLLARAETSGDPLYQRLDASRIAAVGLSLGGLTTQFAAYHRDLRDPRLAAAVSIAGPSSFLERRFFQTSDLPFMMIAGSADAIVPYTANAAPIPDKVDNSLLLSLKQGSHVGFVDLTRLYMRWSRHPDRLICPLLLRGLEQHGNGEAEQLPPDPELGLSDTVALPCSEDDWPRSMRPARQQMLTQLAVYAFLESVFAADPDRRQAMQTYLREELPAENPGARVRFSSGFSWPN